MELQNVGILSHRSRMLQHRDHDLSVHCCKNLSCMVIYKDQWKCREFFCHR